MCDNLSNQIKAYLLKLGYLQDEITTFTSETRFFHDLGFRGDTAEESMNELGAMGVDMKNFVFEDYFPPEFHKSFILNLLPLPDKFLFKRDMYKPLTLAMLDDALQIGSWKSISENKS